MKKEITVEDMHCINEILVKSADKKQFNNNWKISIPTELDSWNKIRQNPSLDKSNEFINDLFSTYRSEKLSSYKKIFDYAFENNIDLFSSFNELRVSPPTSRFDKYPEYLDLIHYVYQKNYYLDNHDFSIYFNVYDKPTKTNIAAQIKLLPALDLSEKSFDIYCKLFDNYFSLVSIPNIEEQKKIKSIFDIFKDKDFFSNRMEQHQKFYPSLLIVEELSDLQEDTYFSKRFCFGAGSRISTLQTQLENSLTFIYNSVFSELTEKEILKDYTAHLEQGYFYLYLFSDNQKTLDNLGLAVNAFHKEIQPFLQNNTESQEYYSKLFESIALGERLAQKASSEMTNKAKSVKNKI